MIGGFVVLLILGVALQGAAGFQVDVASATTNTQYDSGYGPSKVLDGDTGTWFASDYSSDGEQWLNLELSEPQFIGKVIIIPRYLNQNETLKIPFK